MSTITAHIRGIDVAHHDNTVDWKKARASGIRFGFCKLTERNNFTDPQAAANWQGMKAAGVLRGVYHFHRAAVDGEAQARYFLSALAKMGGLQDGDLPPVLDMEVDDDQSAARVRSTALAWLKIVEAETGRVPILYTGPSFADDNLDASFARFPLWIAHYTTAPAPRLPKWATRWTFWQPVAGELKGGWTVPGVSVPVDGDYFNGSEAELLALCKAAPVPAPSPLSTQWLVQFTDGEKRTVDASQTGLVRWVAEQSGALVKVDGKVITITKAGAQAAEA